MTENESNLHLVIEERDREIEGLKAEVREEWTVLHSQGIHPGPFTEQRAREWIAADIKADERRQARYRGQQRLLRRYVSEWQEVPLAPQAEARP